MRTATKTKTTGKRKISAADNNVAEVLITNDGGLFAASNTDDADLVLLGMEDE